jgi:hypothetical protein
MFISELPMYRDSGCCMEKVMIIGLDGLEPSLVTESMTHLSQMKHGITHIDVAPLQTPLIWAAFLTGHTDNGIHTHTRSPVLSAKQLADSLDLRRLKKSRE